VREKRNLNKLAKIIEGLGKEDLLKLKRDLISGNVDRLVQQRLLKYSELNYSEKQCPVCGGEINDDAFILEFGSPYLRRRAFFDAIDCLEYFVNTKLKKKNSLDKLDNESKFDDEDKDEFSEI